MRSLRLFGNLAFAFAFLALRAADAAGAPAPEAAHALLARGRSAAVATDQRLASRAGLRVLAGGGNAVDAAVAIGYALAATYPAAGNLGGGGFMLIHLADGTTHFIDFREKAPAAATPDMYLDAQGRPDADRSTIGPLSAGVPGTVAGLEYARAHFGTRPRATLLAPAIAFASGFTLDAADARELAGARELLARFPSSAAIYLRDGATLGEGERFAQPDLVRTLRAIAQRGVDGFYRGEVARALVAAVKAGGGIISLDDLAGYRAVERTPVSCTFAGATILSAPPPSSGGVTLCETLGIIGAPAGGALRDVVNAHLEIEAERRAFADRNTALGDPDFVPSPVDGLLAPGYIAEQRGSIAADRATPSTEIHGFGGHEGRNTTNYSVVDAAGNAVDVTYTLNNAFGSGFVAGHTGVLLNDEMDDFTSKPGTPNMFGLVQGAANAIAPGKRPLSSMSPTVALDTHGHVVLVTGAAGGPHIITAVLDILRSVIEFHEDLAAAMARPRVHMQWLPDTVYEERGAFSPGVAAALTAMGYRLRIGHASSLANAIAIAPDGTRSAAHDPRSATGLALAY